MAVLKHIESAPYGRRIIMGYRDSSGGWKFSDAVRLKGSTNFAKRLHAGCDGSETGCISESLSFYPTHWMEIPTEFEDIPCDVCQYDPNHAGRHYWLDMNERFGKKVYL